MANYRLLGPDDLDQHGYPIVPITTEPIVHRGARFWVARCMTLPGYAGGGSSPAEAMIRLLQQFTAEPIYKVKIPTYSRTRHLDWVDRQLRVQAAASGLEGSRDSVRVAEFAKRYTVRKQDVHSADKRRAALLQEAGVTDPEVMRHLERATTASLNVKSARWLLENLRPDEVEYRWARERFPQSAVDR